MRSYQFVFYLCVAYDEYTMKKFCTLFVALAVLTLTVSCEKDDDSMVADKSFEYYEIEYTANIETSIHGFDGYTISCPCPEWSFDLTPADRSHTERFRLSDLNFIENESCTAFSVVAEGSCPTVTNDSIVCFACGSLFKVYSDGLKERVGYDDCSYTIYLSSTDDADKYLRAREVFQGLFIRKDDEGNVVSFYISGT